ncbi:hypothetical protein ABFS83_11G057700 [Erythranthe nasuta]
MGRKCSECGKVGHNSRTCTTSASRGLLHLVADHNDDDVIINGGGGGVRLFGVRIDDVIASSASSSSSIITPMKKSLSFDCLPMIILTPTTSSSSSSSQAPIFDNSDNNTLAAGYLSDGPLILRPPDQRRKGVAWTEDEHRTFLDGLEKLGKGDWRGISREYVSTRTPTQIASHAQKYFLRQTSLAKKIKRRSSVFDMVGANQCL